MFATPAEAARYYLARGWQLVAFPARQRGPQDLRWQNIRYSEADLPAHFPIDSNIGIILGTPSGGLVDVDLDCPEAIELAKIYLPPTGMIHGRASKRRSHYWYNALNPKTTKQYRNAGSDTKMLIELRSSDGTKGFQTMVPPSIHPEGEKVEWEFTESAETQGCGLEEPASIEFDDLLDYVRLVAAGALLARNFPKQGARHEFALALGGALLIHGTSADDAREFVYHVCRLGGSDKPDVRANTVYSTAEKLDSRSPTTGIPRLIEIIGEKPVNKIADWLDLRGSISGHAAEKIVEKLRVAIARDVDEEPSDELKQKLKADLKCKTEKDGSPGALLAIGHNAHVLLSHCSGDSQFRWNDVAKRIDASGIFANVAPDALDIEVTNWLSKEFDLHLPRYVVADQILLLAFRNRYDPIRDYLRSLVWDGVPRIDRFLIDHAKAVTTSEDGSDITQIVTRYSRRWFISAAARGLEPGCKVDTVLILEGKQGLGKSRMFGALGGKFFSDTALSLDGNKDSLMRASTSWIIELSELSSLKNARSTDDPKGFLSSRIDHYRLPYGRTNGDAPRHCVFAGTINPEYGGYLPDKTGNRRYWPVRCENDDIDIPRVRELRDQLWAEAVAIFDAAATCGACARIGEPHGCVDHRWWFDSTEQVDADRETESREVNESWIDAIISWWFGLAPDARPKTFNLLSCAQSALKIENRNLTRAEENRLGAALRSLGFREGRALEYGKRRRVHIPTDVLLSAPQRSNRARFDVIKGGKT